MATDIEFSKLMIAFSLTLLAGLSTGIGSALAFYTKQTNKRFLAAALGFSAGVMVYVSFMEIIPEAKTALVNIYGPKQGYLVTTVAFFAGIAIMALIDNLVPNVENPHEMHDVKEMDDITSYNNSHLLRMGFFSAIAISIHNFPEGLATFFGAIQEPALGIGIAIAIAIHNIPEGIAISVPVYYATGSRRKAFTLSFLSGLAEPFGALVGFFLLRQIFTETLFGLIFAAVAGIMVYVSLDELLPSAEKYGEHHVAIIGLICGMVVMATSLILFT